MVLSRIMASVLGGGSEILLDGGTPLNFNFKLVEAAGIEPATKGGNPCVFPLNYAPTTLYPVNFNLELTGYSLFSWSLPTSFNPNKKNFSLSIR